MKIYCVSCKKEVEVKSPKFSNKKGHYSAKGRCPHCKGKVNRFISKESYMRKH